MKRAMTAACRCGHTRADHTRRSGPNSIGQWSFDECAHGWKRAEPYVVRGADGCPCNEFRRRGWFR